MMTSPSNRSNQININMICHVLSLSITFVPIFTIEAYSYLEICPPPYLGVYTHPKKPGFNRVKENKLFSEFFVTCSAYVLSYALLSNNLFYLKLTNELFILQFKGSSLTNNRNKLDVQVQTYPLG